MGASCSAAEALRFLFARFFAFPLSLSLLLLESLPDVEDELLLLLEEEEEDVPLLSEDDDDDDDEEDDDD